MDSLFFQVLVATVAGNLITVWFLYSFYRIHQAEKTDSDEKLIWYGGVIMPALMTAAGIYIIF